MGKRKINPGFVIVFCVIGYICAGPVIANEETREPITANQASALTAALAINEQEPIDLFAESEDDELPQDQSVEVGSFGQIDLHVKGLELTKVLQLLSIQSERNIIASKEVHGQISADLYGVDFYEALDAILHLNGFGYQEKGQFIYVYTTDELKQILEDQRQVVTKVVWLNYISAAEASVLVSPLLSYSGSISVIGEPDPGIEPSLSDAGANSSAHADRMIITDYADNIDLLLDVLEELDVRPLQVLVETTILQARLNEANAFGVDFSIFADLDITNFANPLGAVSELINGEDPAGVKYNSGTAITTSPGNVTAGQSSVKVGIVGSDVALFIRALDSVTDTTVLAAPKITVLNRQKAKLLVGAKLGYLSLQQTETSSTQTVEFLEVGTELTLRPFISNDDYIRLEVRPALSDGDTTRVVNGFVIPEETTQELITNVFVRSGSTIVLGGLFKEDTALGRNQVPGFGDIPGIGNAFKGKDDTVTRNEVIFLIKTTILKDKALTAVGEELGRGFELRRLGARRGLLPWSRSKRTASHLTKSHTYHDAGNTKKALWHVNLALYLDPTLADAQRLKEQLTSEQAGFHDFSLLRQAIDQAITAVIGESPVTDGGLEPDHPADADADTAWIGDADFLWADDGDEDTEATDDADWTGDPDPWTDSTDQEADAETPPPKTR